VDDVESDVLTSRTTSSTIDIEDDVSYLGNRGRRPPASRTEVEDDVLAVGRTTLLVEDEILYVEDDVPDVEVLNFLDVEDEVEGTMSSTSRRGPRPRGRRPRYRGRGL